MVCYVFLFCFFGGGGGGLHFFISSKYDFHVDAERMLLKTREL